MGLNYYASSPVLVSPQSSALTGHDGSSNGFIAGDPCPFQSEPGLVARKFVSKYPPPPSLNYLAKSSTGVAGRKRSRDEVGDVDGNGDELEAASRPLAVQPEKPKPEPILGPGMTLIYPDEPELNISPESQSGTWMEEKADKEAVNESQRPQIFARKSQRRIGNGSGNDSGADESAEIDPVVLHLGVGWRSVSPKDPAVAGSENFIKRQFPLAEPRIVLQHEGMEIYVVRTDPVAAQGYWSQFWLFREDLKSCRFLCNDENDLLRRLNNKRQDARGNWIPDIPFEGPEVFAKDLTCVAEATPKPSDDVDMLEVSAS